MPVLVLNMKEDKKKRAFMADQLDAMGLEHHFVAGIRCEPKSLGCALSHLKAISQSGLKPPFLVLEDDCQFLPDRMKTTFEVPEDTDALYLGHSDFGLADKPDQYGLRWGKPGNVKFLEVDSAYIRVLNMLARHAIIYVSDRFHEATLAAGSHALFDHDFTIPGDMAYALLQPEHRVLATRRPVCFQTAEHGGIEAGTRGSVIESGECLKAAEDFA